MFDEWGANQVYSQGMRLPSATIPLKGYRAYTGQVRLQTRTPDGPKGMLGTFLHIVKNDSVMGLYRGVGPPSVSISSPRPSSTPVSPSNGEC